MKVGCNGFRIGNEVFIERDFGEIAVREWNVEEFVLRLKFGVDEKHVSDGETVMNEFDLEVKAGGVEFTFL